MFNIRQMKGSHEATAAAYYVELVYVDANCSYTRQHKGSVHLPLIAERISVHGCILE